MYAEEQTDGPAPKRARVENFHEADLGLAKMISRRNVPFSLVGDSFFQKVFKKAYPKKEVHAPRYYAETVLPAIADDILEKLHLNLSNSQYGITIDGWSAQQKPSPTLYR